MDSAPSDVEAYVKTSDINAIVSLLSSAIGELKCEFADDAELRIYGHAGIRVIIQPSEYQFNSIWVRGSDRWSSSPMLARFLATNLGCVVRCDPGHEFPEIDPYSDIFLQVDGDTEYFVTLG